jgi:hypothetical protein
VKCIFVFVRYGSLVAQGYVGLRQIGVEPWWLTSCHEWACPGMLRAILYRNLDSRYNPYTTESCLPWTLLRGLSLLFFVASVQAMFIGRSTHSFTLIFDNFETLISLAF